MCPFKNEICESKLNGNPFMTKELRKEHMNRTRLRNKYLKEKTEASAIAYKRQRNKCVSLLKKTKRNYFGNLKPSSICDNKNFWRNVKPLFSEKAPSTDDITLIENNEIISEDNTISEIFVDFFSNAVKSLNIQPYESFYCNENFLNDTIVDDDPVFRAVRKYKNHPSILKIKGVISENDCFSFKPTDLLAVINEITHLNNSKASPLESIPAKKFKENLDILAPKIMTDFNYSLETGIFPSNQKLTNISPIFKDTDKHIKNNYRPVSILSALSKISEKLMSYQINKYMEDKLSEYQCGFRKGMSAQNCLLFMIEKWRVSLDKSGKAGVLLTDLSKAFDCLVHDLLIAKLAAYGFDHLSLKLIYSYLSDRLPWVRINASFSSLERHHLRCPTRIYFGSRLI